MLLPSSYNDCHLLLLKNLVTIDREKNVRVQEYNVWSLLSTNNRNYKYITLFIAHVVI